MWCKRGSWWWVSCATWVISVESRGFSPPRVVVVRKLVVALVSIALCNIRRLFHYFSKLCPQKTRVNIMERPGTYSTCLKDCRWRWCQGCSCSQLLHRKLHFFPFLWREGDVRRLSHFTEALPKHRGCLPTVMRGGRGVVHGVLAQCFEQAPHFNLTLHHKGTSTS